MTGRRSFLLLSFGFHYKEKVGESRRRPFGVGSSNRPMFATFEQFTLAQAQRICRGLLGQLGLRKSAVAGQR